MRILHLYKDYFPVLGGIEHQSIQPHGDRAGWAGIISAGLEIEGLVERLPARELHRQHGIVGHRDAAQIIKPQGVDALQGGQAGAGGEIHVRARSAQVGDLLGDVQQAQAGGAGIGCCSQSVRRDEADATAAEGDAAAE